MKVYKVCLAWGDAHYSSSLWVNHKYRLSYTMGMLTSAPIGYIYAFSDVEYAYSFIEERARWSDAKFNIFLCDALATNYPPVASRYIEESYIEALWNFYQGNNFNEVDWRLPLLAPVGTVMCVNLTPIKVIT